MEQDLYSNRQELSATLFGPSELSAHRWSTTPLSAETTVPPTAFRKLAREMYASWRDPRKLIQVL